MPRLPDALLEDCRCDPAAPCAKDPVRHVDFVKQRRRAGAGLNPCAHPLSAC